MKLILVCLLLFSPFAEAGKVRGYTKKNGAKVHSHQRSKPDHSKANNYSKRGNVNPHTGKRGSK